MTHYEEIIKIAKVNNGIITSSLISKNNIPRWYLSDMVRKEKIIRVARGINTFPSGDYDDFYFFQLKNTQCIYSYTNALYFHELTDRIPFQKEVTVYKGYNSSHIKDGAIIHYVNKNLYGMG
jgi:predicted transcriptional regulator of viral defense system